MPLPDVAIDRINSFDSVMKGERKRRDEPPSPLIDISRNIIIHNGCTRDTDNEESIAVTDRITSSDTNRITEYPR